MGRAGVGRPLGLGRLSLRDSDGVIISPWEILFSLLTFFPVPRLDQPEGVFLEVEGTLGRAVAERPNVFVTFGSSSETNGDSDLRPSITGGDWMFGWIET